MALPTGLPNIVQRNCSLQICYAVTLPTKAAADKVVSTLPEHLLGSGWSSDHGVHVEIAQRSLPARTLGIAHFCSAFSSQYPKLLAPYPSASSISSGLTISYSSLLNECHNGSHLYLICSRMKPQRYEIIACRIFEVQADWSVQNQILLDPPLPSTFPCNT